MKASMRIARSSIHSPILSTNHRERLFPERLLFTRLFLIM